MGKREVHKYYRVAISPGNYLWTCANTDCNHHMPNHYERMLLNKAFICWQCGEHGIIREEHLKGKPEYFIKETNSVHPICDSCRESGTFPIIHLDDERSEVTDEVIANLAKMMKRG